MKGAFVVLFSIVAQLSGDVSVAARVQAAIFHLFKRMVVQKKNIPKQGLVQSFTISTTTSCLSFLHIVIHVVPSHTLFVVQQHGNLDQGRTVSLSARHGLYPLDFPMERSNVLNITKHGRGDSDLITNRGR